MSPRLSTLPSALPRRARRLVTAAVLAVGVVASSVVAAEPASAATVYATSAEKIVASDIARVMNAERAAHHLYPLALNSSLRLSARWHNLAMASHNRMSHQLPGEAYFATRISRAGYTNWTWVGENIGWTSRFSTAGVVALERAMYNERAPYDGHRRNILSSHFRSVGIDVYVDRAHHKVWLTTDFGRRG